MTCCDFPWKKVRDEGYFPPVFGSPESWKKNPQHVQQNPSRDFIPGLRQNVATIIVLMLSYDQWYSIRRSIVPAGKEMTQIISKRLGIKNIAKFNWFFPAIFFVEKSTSLLEVWFRSELSVGESLSRNQNCSLFWHGLDILWPAFPCNSCLSYVVASWTWCFFSAWTIYTYAYT